MSAWRQSLADEAGAMGREGDSTRSMGVLRFGVGMMLGFAAGYLVWSAFLAAFPEAATQVLNALFQGVDFRMLELDGGGATLRGRGVGKALWAAKGFVFGVVYAAVHNATSRRALR